MKRDRIEVLAETPLKALYRRHARRVYGMDLSNWIRMLMRDDYRKNSRR